MSSVASWESLSGWDVFERQRWQGDTRWPHVMRTCSKSEKLLYCDLESCGKPCLVFPWLRTSFSRSPQPELSRGSVSNTKDLQCRMSTVACCQRGKAAQLNKGAGQRAMTTSHPSGSRLQKTARSDGYSTTHPHTLKYLASLCRKVFGHGLRCWCMPKRNERNPHTKLSWYGSNCPEMPNICWDHRMNLAGSRTSWSGFRFVGLQLTTKWQR